MNATETALTSATALREYADLPGPGRVPLLGNTLQIDAPRMHLQLEAWSRQYGDLYRLRLGKGNVLVVGDHEMVAAVLRDRPDGFRRTTRLEQIGLEMGLKRGVFGANGEIWQRQRRMVMSGLDPAHVKAYFPSLAKVTLRLKGRWDKAARDGADIDLQADLMRFTVDAITGLAFGVDVNTLESNDEIIQQHLDKIFPALFNRIMSPIPLWRFVKRRADRELDHAVAEVNKAIDGFIAQARAKMAAEPERRTRPANLLEAMIVAADQPDSGVDDQDVAGNVLTMLLAGEDTTANTLAWMIDLLMRNPRALAAATEEVQRVAPEPRALTIERLAGLEYVEACAHETMRLKPVGPFIPLQALRDTVIGDVRIPRDTIVINLMRRDSVDDRLVADAAQFQPQRWLRDGGPAAAAASAKRISMPFGAGPRICPGRYLALLEIKMAIAMLLGSFDIVSVRTPDGLEPREHLAFTMEPIGLTMRLAARKEELA